MAYIAINNRA